MVYYDGEPLNKYYVVDFLCYENIVVEIKASSNLVKSDFEQTGNYLKAIRVKLGLLVNFGTPSLTYKRLVNSDHS
jgi:GxxExxY protein